MSLIKTNRTTAGMVAISARAKDAAAQAVPMGKRAGTTAVQGARQGVHGAKEWAAPRVQDAVRSAQEWAAPRVQDAVRGSREWAAPRLEGAADAVDTSVAPAVSSALRSAASQIRPAGEVSQDRPAQAARLALAGRPRRRGGRGRHGGSRRDAAPLRQRHRRRGGGYRTGRAGSGRRIRCRDRGPFGGQRTGHGPQEVTADRAGLRLIRYRLVTGLHGVPHPGS